ncbi:hypothetical protein D3C77_113760 [compost metagenome]
MKKLWPVGAYPTKELPPAHIEEVLRRLQETIEARGSAQDKQRRRLLLRGVRAGLWAAQDAMCLDEVYAALRGELFGAVVSPPFSALTEEAAERHRGEK